MIVLVIVLIVALVLTSALLFKLALAQQKTLSESHERTVKHTEGLVDRIMAGDYPTYADRQLAFQVALEGDDEIEPDPIESLLVTGSDRGGFGSRLGLVPPPEVVAAEDEQKLIDEVPQ